MQILCPQCRFSKEVADNALPPLPARVTCPQCGQGFILEAPAAESFATVPPPSPAPLSAPSVVPATPPLNFAGFWLRTLAALLDSVLSTLLQLAMIFGCTFALSMMDIHHDDLATLALSGFALFVTLFYYVFFTGYCGQTPGKMLMRIKVMHVDGGEVSFGQAFIRETIGKTLSGILFFAGYLMVGLRHDKRGLHDLLARTTVIQL